MIYLFIYLYTVLLANKRIMNITDDYYGIHQI